MLNATVKKKKKKSVSSVTLTRSLLFSNPFTSSLVFNVSNSNSLILAYSLFPCLPQFTLPNDNHFIYLFSFPFILCMSYILFAFLLASSLKCLPIATILLTVRATHPKLPTDLIKCNNLSGSFANVRFLFNIHGFTESRMVPGKTGLKEGGKRGIMTASPLPQGKRMLRYIPQRCRKNLSDKFAPSEIL